MKKNLRILILEDVPSDAELAQRELKKVLNNFTVKVVDTENNYVQALNTFKPNLIISDYILPDFNGLAALNIRQAKCPSIPFILLTGTVNEETAVKCIKAGADDYVLKEHIKRLGLAVMEAIKKKENKFKLKQTEEKLLLFRELIENSNDSVFVVNPENSQILDINNQAALSLGYTREELLSMKISDIDTLLSDPAALDAFNYELQEKGSMLYKSLQKRKDGTTFPIEASCKHINYEGKKYGIGITRDISERKKTEELVSQAQKMEAIGQLAGGIAHDFNNILMGIFGNISMIKTILPKDHPGLKYIEDSEKSMDRATHLTSQLLTFAKGGGPVKENICLGDLIKDVSLFDLSGSNVKLVFEQSKDLWIAKVDKGQMQQVFSNLTLNAKQAMPNGGILFISLQNIDIPEKTIPTLVKGKYIKAIIRDEGTGIDVRHLKRIFEPFFTTKVTGKGLGMATVYSIIDKHGGHISVKSTVGKGTTFTLYLPAVKSQQILKTKLLDVADNSKKPQTAKILVMDDEVVICNLIIDMLKNYGFSVSTATDGKQAVNMYKRSVESGAPFDVVIMDLTIPGGIGGKEAVKELLKINPKVKCIVSSGYANDPVMTNFSGYGFKGIASKPYTPTKLMEVINQVLRG